MKSGMRLHYGESGTILKAWIVDRGSSIVVRVIVVKAHAQVKRVNEPVCGPRSAGGSHKNCAKRNVTFEIRRKLFFLLI